MWIPALDPATVPSPGLEPAPVPGTEPVEELPGAPKAPAPPEEEPPAPSEDGAPDTAALEERLNALLEAAGLGIRVRLLGPVPEGLEETIRRAGSAVRHDDADPAPPRHRHGRGIARPHGQGHRRGGGHGAVPEPDDGPGDEATVPPGILARALRVARSAVPGPATGPGRLG